MRQTKIAMAAIAAIAALASCNNGAPPAATGAKTVTSAADLGYAVLPEEWADRLHAGRWSVSNPDGPAPLAVFDLPFGFGGGGGVLLFRRGGAIGYWLVDRIYENPCAGGEPAVKIGATVADLAAALTAQTLTTTTKPVPASIDGHAGLYLELVARADFDYDACSMSVLYIWDTPGTPAGARFIDEPGTDRYWILDVEGQRVVLHTWAPAGVDEETVELLSEIVESAIFVAES